MYKADEYDLRDTRDREVDITLCSLRIPGLMEKIVWGDKTEATLSLARALEMLYKCSVPPRRWVSTSISHPYR